MHYQELRKALRSYYESEADARSEAFLARCLPILDSRYEEGMTAFAMKRLQYRVISDEIDPVIFPETPFYYETATLAAHCDGARDFRGHHHAGGWTHWRNKHLFVDQDPALYQLVSRQKAEKMYLICGPYNDVTQHFCFHHRPILTGGLKAIYEKAMAQLEGASDHERDFLLSVAEGMLCLKAISEKFAKKAAAMAEVTDDPSKKRDLLRIADSAAYTPWEAPRTFYEALNQYAFLRKAIGSLEGIGFSCFGRVDLDLYPFYERDLKEGRLTKEEAYDLIAKFLVTFDCHYDHDMKFVGYADHELENTYVLGGCDRDGNPVCNDLTHMFLRATREEKTIFPKITLRYGSSSPKELFDEANIELLNGTSMILYQNDDATIPAVVKTGHTLEEARDYLIFGCWGLNVCGVEKVDDGSYVNLVKPLELAVHRDFEKMEEIGMHFTPLDDAESFEDVYRIVMDNIGVLMAERARVTRAGGNIWHKVDPLPLFSSTLESCLDKKLDFTEGGAKYRNDRNELFAFGNVLDALMAIKELCFDEKKYTLKEYLHAVRENWQGYEEMRIDATRAHGWGDGSPTSTALAARMNRDLAGIADGLVGTIAIGHLAYTEVRWWGEKTRSTPDGRYSGDYLAQGFTPSRLNRIPAVTSVVNSMAGLDPTILGGNSVLNLILPSTKASLATCEALLRATCRTAVQSLQLNCLSKEQLLDAQKHPEKYPDLIVRVTGFSAKFTSLSPEWQKEFLTRNFYEV